MQNRYIVQIREEYAKIEDQWLEIHKKINLCSAIASFGIELVMFFRTSRHACGYSHSAGVYTQVHRSSNSVEFCCCRSYVFPGSQIQGEQNPEAFCSLYVSDCHLFYSVFRAQYLYGSVYVV